MLVGRVPGSREVPNMLLTLGLSDNSGGWEMSISGWENLDDKATNV